MDNTIDSSLLRCQAAWYEVFDLCASLGMILSTDISGQEMVLSFIRDLAKEKENDND